MEEEGEDQEDKWTRRKVRSNPANQSRYPQPLSPLDQNCPNQNQKSRSTKCKSTNTEQKHNQIASQKYEEKILPLQLVRALLHCSWESWEQES